MITSRNKRAIVLMALGVAAAGLIWRWGALRQATSEHALSVAFHKQVERDARTVHELRARERVATVEAGTSADITAYAQRLIDEHLMPQTNIGRVQLDTPVPLQGMPYERIRATLVLNGMSPPECATFVHHWRLAEPTWPITAIRLNRGRSTRGRRDASVDLFDVTVTLESLVVRPEGEGD